MNSCTRCRACPYLFFHDGHELRRPIGGLGPRKLPASRNLPDHPCGVVCENCFRQSIFIPTRHCLLYTIPYVNSKHFFRRNRYHCVNLSEIRIPIIFRCFDGNASFPPHSEMHYFNRKKLDQTAFCLHLFASKNPNNANQNSPDFSFHSELQHEFSLRHACQHCINAQFCIIVDFGTAACYTALKIILSKECFT